MRVRNTRNNTSKRNLSWLRKAYLEMQTEAIICAGQGEALRTNYITDTIFKRRRNSPYVGYATRKVKV